ncbi:hypothetical protein CcaCcLH18_14241 [Colletotrichum camelliae]|nr:hypothetical protein CcaCcLH18_14241 [Colletotrichum camelliae]
MISRQNSTPRPSDKDWESRKHELYKLYMLDNMNLKMVMEEMTGRHLFCASQRMYKRRFMKWEWFKYQTRRSQSTLSQPGSQGKTCHGKTTRQSGRRNTLQSFKNHEADGALAENVNFWPLVSILRHGE